MRNCIRNMTLGWLAAWVLAACPGVWAQAPSLCLEISPEHPLLIFRCAPASAPAPAADAMAYAQSVIQTWQSLPEDIRPFSTLQVDARGADTAERDLWFRELLLPLQDADVPAVLRVGTGTSVLHPVEKISELLEGFSCVKGIQAVDLPFEEYAEFAPDDPLAVPAVVRWLVGAIDAAAQHGRFVSIELDEIRWPRVMSNVSCKPLYDKIFEKRTCVVPVMKYRGPHTVAQTSALLGLWLEGAVVQWGVAPHSAWYADSRFIEPGVFGPSEQPPAMPPGLYRAMIVNGVMTGATVYSFSASDDLWFGPRRYYWDQAIHSTLHSVIERGLIPRRDFVLKKTRVAYQLAPSVTPEDFHLNLRDIDGVLDKGFLMHGAYGMERPGQVPELILNTGRYFWIPVLSANASKDALAQFAAVVQPGVQDSPQGWTELLARSYTEQDGEGTAFIARVGRATFIMNTCENRYDAQTFKVKAPAPVRAFTAARTGQGVRLDWPFREGDLSYKIYRRVEPETEYALLADAPEERVYLDATADAAQTVAYAITALTSDEETYEGTVNFGEHLILSNVESRIEEEAVLTPMLTNAASRPIERQSIAPRDVTPWWPDMTSVPKGAIADAEAVVDRIEAWDRAFAQESLPEILDIYSQTYEDPQGWNVQYARRAWQWFFEHYNACAMHRQIRQWDFSNYDAAAGSGGPKRIGVLLYCRFSGYALSDPLGRVADLPAWFPRTANGEVWIYFAQEDKAWRVVRTNPALPNFKDILSFSASPYDPMQVGPDL